MRMEFMVGDVEVVIGEDFVELGTFGESGSYRNVLLSHKHFKAVASMFKKVEELKFMEAESCVK